MGAAELLVLVHERDRSLELAGKADDTHETDRELATRSRFTTV
jgi:hypothetical protein